jgi:hypothetical protein
MLSSLTKALVKIANALPRLELVAVLYPTRRMKEAVAELYASIMRFFIRARDWYMEGKVLHAIHSITRPVELRYKDIIEDIEQCSTDVDQLAWACSHAEQRDMHSEVKSLRVAQSRSEEILLGVKNLIICGFIQELSTFGTNICYSISNY